MKTHITNLPDVFIISPKKFGDARGYFTETYNFKNFVNSGIDVIFVQDNQSMSAHAGTVRGLHFQSPPHAQTKLVRVLKGAVFDVVVDLRSASRSYGRWIGVQLTAESGDQLHVPVGFAHGFCTLEPETIVAYKVDDYYAPECDDGLFWADPKLAISWPVDRNSAILSEKDASLPLFADFQSPFV